MFNRENLKTALATTPECLAPEQLETLVDGRVSHPHLASCPRCQAELALLKAFESDTPLPQEGAAVAWISAQIQRGQAKTAVSGRSFSRTGTEHTGQRGSWLNQLFGPGNMRWAFAGVAVAAIAIAGALLFRPEKAPQLQANAGGQSQVYRSQEVRILAPVGRIDRVPKKLEWEALTGASSYRVVLMEVDHTALWTGETRELFVTFPSSLQPKMLPGKPILWQVTALDSEGRGLAASQIEKFTVSERHP